MSRSDQERKKDEDEPREPFHGFRMLLLNCTVAFMLRRNDPSVSVVTFTLVFVVR